MRSPLALRASLVAALLVACAHPRPPPPLHAVRLEVEKSNGMFRPFVHATLAGERMKLVVDTGAFASILPSGFARAHALKRGSPALEEKTFDANGHVSTTSLLPGVPVQFDGEVAAGTMDFRLAISQEDYGILAPRELVRPGWAVVLDFEREELRYEREEAALQRLGAGRAPATRLAFHSCVHEGWFNELRRFVPATIDGTPVDMLLDTGADSTMLARNNPALPKMVSKVGSRSGVVGVTSRGQGLMVDDVAVGFSGATYTVSAMVVPVTDPCADGLLGMDVLRHCTIVWGAKTLSVACRAPGGGHEDGEAAPVPGPARSGDRGG